MESPVRVGVLTPIEILDPRTNLDFANFLVYWHIFEPPFRPSADGHSTEAVFSLGELLPESSAATATAWSLEVTKRAAFSDGTPVDAAIFAASLRESRSLRDEVKIEVSGQKVIFRLSRPHSCFDKMLCHVSCSLVRRVGNKTLGTGPYVPVTDHPNGNFRLRRNPYYSPTPRLEEIEFAVFPADPDGRARLLIEAVERGEVDFTLALARDDLLRIRGVHKWMGQSAATAFLFLNVERPWLIKASHRRALALAIDRRALAAQSYASPLAFAATGLLPPSVAIMPDGHRPDVVRARAELDALGRPGRPLSMLVVPMPRPHLPHPRRSAELLIAQLQEVGIDVQLIPCRDQSDFLAKAGAGEYDLALSGWIPDTPDLTQFFEALLGTEGIPNSPRGAVSRGNLSHWSAPAMDEALLNYRLHPGSKNLYRINEILSQERPLLPLMYGSQIVAHSWRLKNRPSVFDQRPFLAEMHL